MKLISTACDVHAGAHEAKERTLVLDGQKLVIDACDGFVNELLTFNRNNLASAAVEAAGLTDMVIPNGSKPPAKKVAAKAATAKKTAAPIPVAPPADENGMRAADGEFPCFCCSMVLMQSGWQGHAKTHGFATARDMVGDVCPLCKDQHGRLTNHAKEKHNIANVALLFQTALRDGDPHGIVAKRIKAAKKVRLV